MEIVRSHELELELELIGRQFSMGGGDVGVDERCGLGAHEGGHGSQDVILERWRNQEG